MDIWLIFQFFRLITIVLLLGAIAPNPYGYYIGLRYAVFVTSLCGIWFSFKSKRLFFIVLFCVTTILFNPFIPFHLKRNIWVVIDVIAAVIILISFFAIKVKISGVDEKMKNQMMSDEDANERPARETELWQKALSFKEIEDISQITLSELRKMKPTNWGNHVLKAVCTHSPELAKFMVDGNINLEYIRDSEMKGMSDAVKAIKKVHPSYGMTLRELFASFFAYIYKETNYSEGNKFYWFGRDRVIQRLRSFTASKKTFAPHVPNFYGINGEELSLDTNVDDDTLSKVQKALDYFEQQRVYQKEIEQLREHYQFDIDSEYPIIEFELNVIGKIGNFKYEGSLVNSLYNELRQLLYVMTDYAHLETRGSSHALYDAEACIFACGAGVIVLVKYAGLVEYFPDRLYVELQDIVTEDPIIMCLKSYKFHLEGND